MNQQNILQKNNLSVLHTLSKELKFTDSHIHLADLDNWTPINNSYVCSCAHSKFEMEKLNFFEKKYSNLVYSAFASHPQNPSLNNIPLLENLLSTNSIKAIGEIGFDFYSKELAANFSMQQEVWNIQLELAIKYNKPIIIHCIKGIEKIFTYSKLLTKLPAVVFHSFGGSSVEAHSLMKRGINCFFSFGKPLLRGNKRAIQCVKELPHERLLAETDAPFQKLPTEKTTLASDIVFIYKELAEILELPLEEICKKLEKNFFSAFN